VPPKLSYALLLLREPSVLVRDPLGDLEFTFSFVQRKYLSLRTDWEQKITLEVSHV
jgi:hypothetical protein